MSDANCQGVTFTATPRQSVSPIQKRADNETPRHLDRFQLLNQVIDFSIALRYGFWIRQFMTSYNVFLNDYFLFFLICFCLNWNWRKVRIYECMKMWKTLRTSGRTYCGWGRHVTSETTVDTLSAMTFHRLEEIRWQIQSACMTYTFCANVESPCRRWD